jgi:CubicO group peptidase (beta-lactamase class C family)
MGDLRCNRRTLLAWLVAASLIGPSAYAQTPAFNQDRLQALEAQLRSAPNVRAFLMERRGTPFAWYRQDTTPTTRLNVASVTKSVLALLVGIAIGQGAIASVDEPLSAFFPEHAQGPNAAALQRVTLRHLLTLSPGFDRRGLDTNTDYPDFRATPVRPGPADPRAGPARWSKSPAAAFITATWIRTWWPRRWRAG